MQNLRLPIDVELVYCAPLFARAGVVELVDTGDSKSPALKSVPVQVRPSVPQASSTILSPYVGRGFLYQAPEKIVKVDYKVINGFSRVAVGRVLIRWLSDFGDCVAGGFDTLSRRFLCYCF